MNNDAENFDYDYLVIGSGFGGSISAMRLAQKGYTVGIIEAGKIPLIKIIFILLKISEQR